MRRRQRATSRSWSFFECPYIGDNPGHLVLLHAAAEERLHRTAGAVIDESATASTFPRYSLTPVALTFFTAGISTSPVCSGNVMGELSRGLLKSDRSPAVAGDRPSVPPTTANANSDTRGAEKKFSCIDRKPICKGILNTGLKTAPSIFLNLRSGKCPNYICRFLKRLLPSCHPSVSKVATTNINAALTA